MRLRKRKEPVVSCARVDAVEQFAGSEFVEQFAGSELQAVRSRLDKMQGELDSALRLAHEQNQLLYKYMNDIIRVGEARHESLVALLNNNGKLIAEMPDAVAALVVEKITEKQNEPD